MRKIIHIDMDCFYAAIEMRDNPSLVGKPIAVGGTRERRGVLCTSNYEARKYGVRSAMPTAHALQLCPQLILLPVDMAKYKAVALKIREIFSNYTDIIEPLSLDEAYLDVTHCQQLQGSATKIATAIREQIFKEHQLTASAGIAPNKFLAKVASDWHKPNGQYVITPKQVDEFIVQLPVTKIPGVGKVTAKKMHDMSLHTCADLQKLSLEQLTEQFGLFGQKLFNYCRGIDNREVENLRIRKSVSVEETFINDLTNLTSCMNKLPTLLNQLNQRLQPYTDKIIKNQFIKIKFNNFTQTTAECISSDLNADLYQQLCQIAYQRYQLPVRLLGLGVHFRDKNNAQGHVEQLSLNIA